VFSEKQASMQVKNVRIQTIKNKQVGVVMPTHFNTGFVLNQEPVKTGFSYRKKQ
jgi:hypothetical protein